MRGLQFIYEPNSAVASMQLAERLQHELEAGKQVLWVVSGGSNIGLSARIMQYLENIAIKHLDQLHCILSDERYGVPGHVDSNWQQFKNVGFMIPGLDFPPVLMPDITMDDTCQLYSETVIKAMDASDVIVAQLGLGGDGHIAGILPHSAAITDEKPIVGYDAGTYQRITMTPPLLRRVDAAYSYAYGETKHRALARLRDENIGLGDQPAQILKQLPEAFVFSDLPNKDTKKEGNN